VATTYNNPTGTLLSAARRRQLLELARRSSWTIVEDETLCDISLRDAMPPPPIAALDPTADVITIGSACKLFWGGLRIGWLRAPASIIDEVAPMKVVADLGTSLVGQALCAELLPLRDRVRAERREALGVRYQALGAALTAQLPGWRWSEPRGGSTLWIELPHGDSAAFAQIAAGFGVILAPGNVFSSADRYARRLRLPFVLAPDVLRTGVSRLAAAWDAYAPRARSLDAVV
jgi:DNA-binding transcriptional MocR family regulator